MSKSFAKCVRLTRDFSEWETHEFKYKTFFNINYIKMNLGRYN